MRKLLIGLLGAAALGASTGANASVTVDAGTTVSVTGPTTTDGGTNFAIGFSDSGIANPFNELLVFTNSLTGSYSFTLTSSSSGGNDADFDAVYLTGGSIIGQLAIPENMASTDPFEIFGLLGAGLAAGTYTLHLEGSSAGQGSFGGNIAFVAVPEPATWGMMLLGFGVVGFAMRRRSRPALLQIA
jgi:hypothetical protein